jgi:ribosomal protein S18
MDTETVGTFGKPIVHDWGWQIVDKDFHVLTARRYLVEELHLHQQWILKASDFYNSKHSLYVNAIEEKSVKLASWRTIVKQFLTDIRNYNVKVISAYNLAFDYKAINYTNLFFDSENEKLMKVVDSKSLLCLWNLACDTILNTEDYKDYATMKNFISEKGNYLTSAEACYSYLINDEHFEEEHTALEDVKIETEILKHIVTNCKGKVQYGLAYSCWQKVQK